MNEGRVGHCAWLDAGAGEPPHVSAPYLDELSRPHRQIGDPAGHRKLVQVALHHCGGRAAGVTETASPSPLFDVAAPATAPEAVFIEFPKAFDG
jgi:hypothetical protein